MPEHHAPFEGFRDGGEPERPAEPSPSQRAKRPPCCVEGGSVCAEAREGIRRKLDLAPRQMEVAACVMAGQSDKEIARTLDIDRDTVHSHIRAIYTKLGVHSRSELYQKLRTAQHAWLHDSPPVPIPPTWCSLNRPY